MLIDCPFDGFPVILVEKLNLLHMLFHISPVISRPVPGKEVGSRHGVIAPAADRKTKGIVLRHRLHRISRLLQGSSSDDNAPSAAYAQQVDVEP